ncbi:DNRLRE domain-containing protein [Kribbella turkmenica]|uniref:DNRLRE domain-containing protein n=1 Tax=Kribbella turkmenica TaxID=2530375 RepID=A0A4R4XGG0_9ACTN|nr:right-handed parallel beta-helix repeat-containing protein [Kribbella turkmenica]TDD29679.1 DNRLRE domain-containing protein [Kribbella turkmenica]
MSDSKQTRRRLVAVTAALTVLIGLVAVPVTPAAASSVYAVTTTVDAVDAAVGDGICATSAGACSLRAAIQESNASTAADTVQVPAGNYALTLPPQGDNLAHSGDLDITRPLNVLGAGATTVTVDANGIDRLVEIHPEAGAVTISGLALREGAHEERGGGLLNSSTGTVRLQNVAVRDSSASTFGGGIANEGTGRLDLTGVTVEGNRTDGEGGGISTGLGTLTITGTSAAPSRIADNEARTGGGLFNSGEPGPDGLPSLATISGATVEFNDALGAGGGVFVGHEGELIVADSTFKDNTAVEYGGAVAAVAKTTVTISRGAMEGNTAGGSGGGLFSDTERPVSVTGVTLTGNIAGDPVSGDGGGGGIEAGGSGAITVSGSTFAANTSIAEGGALATSNNGSVTVRDSTFRDNSSTAGGGAIANSGMRTSLERLVVSGNRAGAEGGGILNDGSGDFTLLESTLSGNTAASGGGLANEADGALRVVRSTIWNNSARSGAEEDSGLGGGVYGLGDAEATYENTTISGNYAQVRGGGLYIDSDSTVHVNSTTISHNSSPVASGVGGEVTVPAVPVVPSPSVILRNSVVAGNRLGADCNFAIGSEGGNLDSADTCYFRGPRDRNNVGDPRLDAVADNGGPTMTQALRVDSFAVDGGVSPCPPTDQRGVTRPKNGRCDSGAFEHEGPFGPPDTTPPTTTLIDPPASVGETATFRFGGADNVTPLGDLLFECRILNNDPTDPPDPTDPTEPPDPEFAFVGCPNPYVVQAVEEGQNRIEVRAVDRAGNTDQTPAVHEFVAGQDGTPPQTIFTLTPPNPSNGRTATFGFTATDDITPPLLIEFECRLDSTDEEAWVECFNPTTFSNLTPGQHTVQVRAIDEMDNIDPTPATYTWTVASPVDCDEANVTLPAVADSWVDEANPLENFGSLEELTVRSDSPGADARALVRFGLPGTIPAGCELTSATLRLHSEGGEPGRTLAAVPIDAAWAETAVTWNNQPAAAGTAVNATSGSGFREWNLIAAVTAMLAGGPNHGFLIRDTAEEADPAAEQSFASRQVEPDPSQPPVQPQLVLRFGGPGTPPPPPPADPVPATVSCGQVLTQSTKLLNDLTDCPLDGLVIGAPNIAVDLNGHTVDGPGYFPDQPGSPIELPEDGLPAGVRNVGYAGVVVRNGTITEFGYGVHLMAGSRFGTVQGLTLRGNATAGIELSDADDGRNGNKVIGNTLTGNEVGIALYDDSENSLVENNTLTGNFGVAIHAWSGSGHQVTGNRISGVTTDPLLDSDGGIRLEGSTDNVLVANTVSDTGDAGVIITAGAHRNRVEDGTFSRTGDAGVSVEESDGSQVLGNAAYLASDSGVSLTGANSSVVRGNDVRFNPGGVELDNSSDNLIEDNDAGRSTGSGISVSGDSFRNRILANTAIATGADGISIVGEALDANGDPAGGNLVQGNTAHSNLGDGVSTAAGHTLTGNLTHNNAAYGIQAAEPNVDGGGNVANGNGNPEQCAGVVCGPGAAVPPVLPDLVAPDTRITAAPADPSSSSGTAVFSFTGTDDVAPPSALRFECRLDGPPIDPNDPDGGEGWAECPDPTSYGFLPAGEHTFDVRAIDPSGNVDLTPASVTWTVVPAPPGPDDVPPSTTIYSGPDLVSSSTEATFGFRGSDNATPGPNLRYECKFDSGAFTACVSPRTYSGLALGEHTIQVRAIDLAGNVDPTPATRIWTIEAPPPDTTAPDTLIASGPDASTVAATATFTFTSTEPGSTFACALDGTTYVPCTSPRTLSGLTVGDHTFRVRATDAAGNADQSPAAYSWTVQSAPVPVTVGCGQVLTRSSLITNDLTNCPNDGLVIGASGITIDLDGSVIDGIGQGTGIRNPGFDSVTITGGTVQEFDYGVQLTAGTALGIVGALTIRLNQEAGVQLVDADDGVNGNIVRENSIAGNGAGLSLGGGTQGAAVLRNTIGGSALHGIRVLGATGNTLEGNTVTGSSENGMLFDAAGNNTVVSNSVTASAKSAILVQAGSHANLIRGNTLREGEAGIELTDSDGTEVVANIANQMDKPGIVLERAHDTVVRGNDVRFNGGGIELLESNNNRLESNNASENSDTGISLGALSLGNVVLTNDAGANDSDGISVEAEVLPGSVLPGNLLERNTAHDNSGDGITVNKAGHTVTANSANSNDGWGIYAEIDNVDGGGNRAVGNTEPAQCYTIECNGGPPVPPELAPPDTELLEFPANPSGSRSAAFIFTGIDDNTPLTELAFECRIDNGAFTDCENPRLYSGLAPGTHTFQVRAVDLAGKVDPTPASYAWVIELPPPGVPPDTTVQSGPPVQTPLENALFTFGSNEPDTTFQCSLDGAAFTACTSPQEYEEVAYGAHEFQVRAIDPEGNVDASPAVHTWTRTGPPVVTITSGPADPTTQNDATFAFTANEPVTKYECSIDLGAFTECTSPVTFEGLAVGDHSLRIQATDLDELVSGPDEMGVFEWTVEPSLDDVPPQTVLTSGPATPSGDATFVFAGTDNVTSPQGLTFECRLDSDNEADFAECTSPYTYPNPDFPEPLTVGQHTVDIRAIDVEDNVDPTPVRHTWTYSGDTAAPSTTFVSGPPATTAATEATISFNADDPFATFECSLDNAPFEPCESPHQVQSLEPGAHELRVRATDLSGNTETTPVVRGWTVVAAPETTITSGPAATTTSTTATFAFSSDQAGSTFACSLNGSAFTVCTSPATYTVAGGLHEFAVRATNGLGQVDQSPAEHAWTVDAPPPTPPETTITGQPDATTSDTTATFTFVADQAGSTFECSVDEAPYSACTSPVHLTGLAIGEHVFSVRATDPGGEVDATPADYEWDVTAPAPPDTTIGTAPSATTTATTASFTFSATKAGSTFRCSLDGAAATVCTSPVNLTGLALGSHTFRVHAVDPDGLVDATPAVHTWTITTPAPVCTPTTVTVGAVADSWLLQSSGGQNYGTDSVLKVDTKSGANARAVVRFNLPAIPAGCQLLDAKLRLYATSYKSGRTLQALRLNGPWTETNVTWNNQPATTGTAATAASPTSNRYVEWSVVSQLQSMYAGGNHGFLIRDAVENGGGSDQGFHSREKGTDNPPRLVFTFG